MLVQFTVIPTKHMDGTQEGINRAMAHSFDITERRFSTPDEAVSFWQKKYPQTEYDIDDVKCRD